MTEISKFFERLGSLIPGYRGYSNRNAIRESDYQLRLYIKQKIENLIVQIEKSKNSLDDEKFLKIDKIQNNLKLFCVKIANQSYGYSAMFDTKNAENDVRERKLSLLIENDEKLINIIQELSIKNHDIDGLSSLEKDLDELLIQRKEIIT